jgi:hypothetical protein
MRIISNFFLFETLENVNQLISDMTEVTASCLAKIITPSNSIALKNLLIDDYIRNIDHDKGILVQHKRGAFKDWLAEKLSQKLQTTATSALPICSDETRSMSAETKEINMPVDNISSIIPITNFTPALHTRTVRRNTYSTEVFRFTFPDASISFHTVARLFNTRFACAVHSSCKLVQKERCRKLKDNTTQLFKCNCCTTTVLLQFRHATDITSDCMVQVFIKNNMVDIFNCHFTTRTTTNNDITT